MYQYNDDVILYLVLRLGCLVVLRLRLSYHGVQLVVTCRLGELVRY